MANSTAINFYTASYEKIQSYIESGAIQVPAYILCKDDKHENNLIFVNTDLLLRPVKGYQQESIVFVDKLPTEDYRTDAFYFYGGIGYLFINDNPVPVFKDITDSTLTSYDQLTDVPIVNKYGEPTAPITIFDLEDGSYSINGNYVIGGNLSTVFSTSRKTIFLIETDEENKYITRFDGNQIVVYTVSLTSMTTEQSKYAKESWILEQGFATETYVTQAIEDLYTRIANEVLITKVSQLENDKGYLTADDINGIDYGDIVNLF